MRVNAITTSYGVLRSNRIKKTETISTPIQDEPNKTDEVSFKGGPKGILGGILGGALGGVLGFCVGGPVGAVAGAALLGGSTKKHCDDEETKKSPLDDYYNYESDNVEDWYRT